MNTCVCGKPAKKKYCSNVCQGHEKSMLVVQAWYNNPTPETFYDASHQPRTGIRAFLIKKSNCACSICGWNLKHPSAELPALEIEHVDGNWLNCHPDNIIIICPNCHSLTDTYKARNTGNGRTYRRM